MNITQMNNQIKYCRVCNCELILGSNWAKVRENNSQYICRNCSNKHTTEWGNNNKDKIKGYKQSDKGKARDKRYRGSKKGKVTIAKHDAKRRRELGFELLFDNPFPKNIPVDNHHISDGFVVAIPRSLHSNYLHSDSTKLHREELKPYIESIYNITYILEESD